MMPQQLLVSKTDVDKYYFLLHLFDNWSYELLSLDLDYQYSI